MIAIVVLMNEARVLFGKIVYTFTCQYKTRLHKRLITWLEYKTRLHDKSLLNMSLIRMLD